MSKQWVAPLGGNKIFLTCVCGLDPIEMGRRTGKVYSESKSTKYHFGAWLEHHAGCSPDPDHFRLAHESNPNWDQPLDADPVSNAVRLELVKSV